MRRMNVRTPGPLVASIAVAVSLAALAVPARADGDLAGARLATSSHGQPFCPTRARLQELLRATVTEQHFPTGTFADCAYVPDTATVTVLEDLTPRSRAMHLVRARVNLLFGPVEGYTYSVGLYDAKVFPKGILTFR